MAKVLHNETHHAVTVPAQEVNLQGDLAIPSRAQAIVLFVHGSGSSRLSPRNKFVASRLNQAGLATLLFDLLTEQEEKVDMHTAQLRFDIKLLSQRVVAATRWVFENAETRGLPVGFFGASTGAAAALVAATKVDKDVGAVVSRGGRPDLAGAYLAHVKAPTLLIVGERDRAVIELNNEAMRQLSSVKRMVIIPGASHLFEEPGTLEQAADYARDWFTSYLPGKKQAALGT